MTDLQTPELGTVTRRNAERLEKRREATRERVKRWRRRRTASRHAVTCSVTSAALAEALAKKTASDSRGDSLFVQEARTYEQIIAAIVRRRTELGLSQAEVDELAGLQSGYTGKCEKPSASYGRIMGDMSFRTLLQTLGLKLLVVEIDPTGKLAKAQDRVKVTTTRRGAGKKKGKR